MSVGGTRVESSELGVQIPNLHKHKSNVLVVIVVGAKTHRVQRGRLDTTSSLGCSFSNLVRFLGNRIKISFGTSLEVEEEAVAAAFGRLFLLS
mmetsp:Transcript_32786/g.75476  ORF Transcript_32786/g.75476 Transcript_32786/m.75476 type:complete len:93 (-) Transcript_32786:129-407(-)